jgi:hypothetical protein
MIKAAALDQKRLKRRRISNGVFVAHNARKARQ